MNIVRLNVILLKAVTLNDSLLYVKVQNVILLKAVTLNDSLLMS